MGYFLLSKGNDITDNCDNGNTTNSGSDSFELENLERAAASFRIAIDTSMLGHNAFLPAYRGLAVATRRRRLLLIKPHLRRQERKVSAGAGVPPDGKDGDNIHQVRDIFSENVKREETDGFGGWFIDLWSRPDGNVLPRH